PVGGAATSTLDFVGDRDWHAVDLVAGRAYRIDLAGAGADAVGDTYLRLYDGDATLVDEDDDGGDGLNSSLIFTASVTGRHFVSAGAYADGDEGGYRVAVEDLGAGDDFSGDVATAGRLPTDGETTGELELAGDRDWFRVTLVRGATYQFDAMGSGAASGALSDPVMNLYGPDGARIASDDDGGEGLNARLTYFADLSGAL
ncbi:MAG: pre-peptidase C-terminal domain-containing protein, partial [Pseudomonadota bacterium]|nr:pre-peptidase C-terminal domain-containing protein [Pseudomonadota bacterium]